ncbi:endolytic transglycosylase MltG [Mitsuokella sp. WILCCON 0060]|uniref:endolytic transglycosylase MltG n=1 Tax=unclassified Mitsuokella TaxID=2637239 RepID=UPI003F058ABC
MHDANEKQPPKAKNTAGEPKHAEVKAETQEAAKSEQSAKAEKTAAKSEKAESTEKVGEGKTKTDNGGEKSAKQAGNEEEKQGQEKKTESNAEKSRTDAEKKSDQEAAAEKAAETSSPADKAATKVVKSAKEVKPAEPAKTAKPVKPVKSVEVSKKAAPVVTIEKGKMACFKDKLKSLGWKKWTAIAAVFIVLVGGGFGMYLAFGTTAVMQRSDRDAQENIYMTVKPGTTASEISDRLTKLGVIDSKFRFWWLMKLQGDASKFKTGTYAFKAHMDEQDVLNKLVSGDTTIVKFTIPEGFGVKEIAKRLADEGLVDENEFLEKAKNYAPYSYMKKGPNVRYAAEGYLFPDTYEIQSDVTPELIMKMMSQDFDNRLTPEMRQQAAAMGLSIHDLVTLASLVEKEARYDEDRPIIAQVFLKRLQIGMPLQSDTTLQYLMNAPKEDVSLADTKIDSPYNTYQHQGLPPGPIASPGMKAINAVLHPAATDYLYFVADRQGHNHYSATYEEHEAIVEQVR